MLCFELQDVSAALPLPIPLCIIELHAMLLMLPFIF